MLSASMLGDYSTSVSSTLSCFFIVPTCWETRFSSRRYSTYFFFSSSFFDHHTGHPARHDARILLFECVLDALRFFHHRFDLLEDFFL
jgi:hypothetical protein